MFRYVPFLSVLDGSVLDCCKLALFQKSLSMAVCEWEWILPCSKDKWQKTDLRLKAEIHVRVPVFLQYKGPDIHYHKHLCV